MVGRKRKRGIGALGLMTLCGCHGGMTLHTIVLLVTVGIFMGTILLDRS